MKSQRKAGFLFRCFSIPMLLLLFCPTAFGQTADLSGAITDSSHAVVPGASIAITRESTGLALTSSSNDQGLYSFAILLPGSYTVSVEAAGFRGVTNSGVKLDPGQQARLDFELSPAGLKQSVTVRGDTFFVHTESSAVGTNVEPPLVQDLPSNGRSFQSLILLTPGVLDTSITSDAVRTGGGGFSVNGQRGDSNYFTVDGVSANMSMGVGPFGQGSLAGGTDPAFDANGTTHSLLSMDDMEEFKLQTSTYSAEFGRAAGGQAQIVSKSGSNEFHGSVFDYFRNDALDANGWFANAGGLPKAALHQNDFGGVFGGPILTNRTFFFFSYEGLRNEIPASGTTQVPSLTARQMATGAIQQLLNTFPLPNGPEDPASMLANLTTTGYFLGSSNNTSIRIDHEVNDNLRLFGRYSEAPSENNLRGLGGSNPTVENFRFATVGATLGLSQTMISDLRLNYSRNEAGGSAILDSSGGAVPAPNSLLFPAPFASPKSSLTFISFEGPAHFREGRFADNMQRQGNIVSNTSLSRGRHEIKFGADFRYLTPHYGPFDYRMTVFFSGIIGALSGVADDVSIQSLDSVTEVFHNLSLFAQDSWKATPRLTLTFGLRWELNPPPSAKNGQQLLTVIGFPDAHNLQLSAPGTPVYPTRYTDFAPRLGIAYQLSRDPGKATIVRGGFGIFYDLGVGNSGDTAVTFPHLRVEDLGAVPFPLSPQDVAPPPPVSLGPPYSGVFNAFVSGYTTPRSYQWNFTVDQNLGPKQMFSASYVGELGRKLLRLDTFNLRALYPFPTRPFRGCCTTINLATNASSSDYQALQVQFQRRMSGGLAALVSYTWSHSIDNTPNNSSGTDTFMDPNLDRGSSDFDVRHAFKAGFTYKIPAPSWRLALRPILTNWLVASLCALQTALPVDVYVGRGDAPGPTALEFRPDLVPGVPIYIQDSALPGGRGINPAAFSVPTELRQGNLGRNAIRGFNSTQLDFSVQRQFAISEKTKLEWRTDFFDLFNSPSFYVDGELGSFPPFQPNPTFGEGILTVGGPRQIQLALRLSF
jgi:Carboxypeptidase regulatory-like domain